MARPLRINLEEGVYHVMSRGFPRKPMVRSDRDRWKWTDLLGDVATRRRWQVYAWVLVDSHYHIFLKTPDADLSEGMHDLNAGYVSYFNATHGKSGPLFRGRYKAILVEQDYHYWELSRYIHLNPVRAGMVKRAERYKWGSCAYYFGKGEAPEWLCWEEILGPEGKTLTVARREYRKFLVSGLKEKEKSPFQQAEGGMLLGSEGFVEKMKIWIEEKGWGPEVPQARALRPVVDPDRIDEEVEKGFGEEGGDWRCRGRHGNEARAVAMLLCRRLTKMKNGEIGERYGGVSGGAVSLMVKKQKQRLLEDERSAERVDAMARRIRGN